jgi:hypothetical protein
MNAGDIDLSDPVNPAEKSTPELIGEMREALRTGEYHVKTEDEPASPFQCVDGRPLSEGEQKKRPKMAGGIYSVMTADMLTFQKYKIKNGQAAKTTAEYADNFFGHLNDNGHGEKIGGHCDDSSEGGNCGCGAIDKMGTVLDYLAHNPEKVRKVAAYLGVTDEEADEIIFRRALELRDDDIEMSSGQEMLKKLRNNAKEEENVEELTGKHNEKMVVVNSKPDTTLDKAALEKEFGKENQAFNVDVWAFKDAAEMIASDEKEAHIMQTAMTYYNIATAHVLAGEDTEFIPVGQQSV